MIDWVTVASVVVGLAIFAALKWLLELAWSLAVCAWAALNWWASSQEPPAKPFSRRRYTGTDLGSPDSLR